MVDADLILRIFTPPAMKQFSLTYDHVGKSIRTLRPNLRYPKIVESIMEVIESNEVFDREIQTTDGSWFHLNIVPYVEHEEERINGVIITFVNITKRLNALRDLEKLNARHETVMYALSHDIRQPIAAITLLADGLLLAHQRNNTGQFEKWIENLKQSSKSLQSLVNDFTAGHDEDPGVESTNGLNIRDICDDVLTALRWEIKAGGIEIITDFNVSEIVFPKNNLRSVVYNLIHNAVKFSDPKKKSRIEIKTLKAGDFVVLCIGDNGLGIAEEHQKQVFQKSARLNKKVAGTGMGLYVVKRMVEANKGRIQLESKKGEGSIFKIFFRNEHPENNNG